MVEKWVESGEKEELMVENCLVGFDRKPATAEMCRVGKSQNNIFGIRVNPEWQKPVAED